MVGLVGSFHEWLTEYGKRKWRSYLWRARAAMKNKNKKKQRSGNSSGGGGKNRVNKFQYDPWSYALNFDDGIGRIERADAVFVYVLWVKPE
ncbi:hypothetical protein EUGRSUZ_E03362 [Eucalyptus grandis]|uniref:Uncharacterized protein n=3 Tax=Eucalyptus TaxID=3932 RepID=A0ACC3KYV4_EUCGR|nr:hypothetical protein EUGRSUZ_E03362 [Eucalyptus grandis]